MAKLRISSDFIVACMQHQKVRAALDARRDRVAAAAASIAAAEEVDLPLTTSSGTRPKGRPYSRVSTSNVSQEWGDSETDRRRVMGRAAESH